MRTTRRTRTGTTVDRQHWLLSTIVLMRFGIATLGFLAGIGSVSAQMLPSQSSLWATSAGSEWSLYDYAERLATPSDDLALRTAEESGSPTDDDSEEPGPAQRTWLAGNWGGKRDRLEQAGFAFDFSLIAEGSTLRSELRGRYLIDVDVTVDGKTAWGIDGATFFLEAYTTDGEGTIEPAAIQSPSNIEAGRSLTQVSRFWWEQWSPSKRWRLKAGKVDANTEFDFVAAAGTLLNGAAGFSPTIALPSYPDPALSLNVFHYPSESLRLGLGVYDGSGATGVATGSSSLRSAASALLDGQVFTIGEISFTKGEGDHIQRRFSGGAWSSRADPASGESDPWGLFALSETRLFTSSNGPRIVDGFVQLGWSDPDRNQLESHVSVGALWTAPSRKRPDDSIALYVTTTHGPAVQRETAIEVAYTIPLTPAILLTLDGQSIRNSGGVANGTEGLLLIRVGLSL